MAFDEDLGPIGYVVVSFDSLPLPPDGFAGLSDLVDSGRIHLLDVEFVVKQSDGSLELVEADAVGLPTFVGASSGIIDADDVALAGAGLDPGGVVAIVVYEDLTLLPVLQRWVASGGAILAQGPIVVDDLVDALDSTERN